MTFDVSLRFDKEQNMCFEFIDKISIAEWKFLQQRINEERKKYNIYFSYNVYDAHVVFEKVFDSINRYNKSKIVIDLMCNVVENFDEDFKNREVYDNQRAKTKD